jgi:hypothetical protein
MDRSPGDTVGGAPDFITSVSRGLFVLSATGFLGHSIDGDLWNGMRRSLLAPLLESGVLVLATNGHEPLWDWSDVREWQVQIRSPCFQLEGVRARKPEALELLLEDGAFDMDAQVLLRHASDDAELVRKALSGLPWLSVETICLTFEDVVHMFCDGAILVWRRRAGFNEDELRACIDDWCAPRHLTWVWRDEAVEFEENWVLKTLPARF